MNTRMLFWCANRIDIELLNSVHAKIHGMCIDLSTSHAMPRHFLAVQVIKKNLFDCRLSDVELTVDRMQQCVTEIHQ